MTISWVNCTVFIPIILIQVVYFESFHALTQLKREINYDLLLSVTHCQTATLNEKMGSFWPKKLSHLCN